ncbi:pimeloyl-ACP methyl esterase BioG family protein [Helicobacter canis]|nr:pimeloyl-ACP methyl esterase BioG family protein [Helicobacter canis]
MQIAFSKPFDKSATTLLLCFSGFATKPRLLAHLACDIPACNVAICYDYRDLPKMDLTLASAISSQVESSKQVSNTQVPSTLSSTLQELQELIDSHRHCILVAFSLGVSVASRLLASIDRLGAFGLCVAINGTPLGISAKYGIHPRIYARTLEYFDVQEFARAFFGIDDRAEIGEALKARGFSDDCSTLFGSVLECKDELLALQQFCLSVQLPKQAIHFTHAIISSKDCIFSPMVVESSFVQTNTKCHHIDAPHYAFGHFTSWLELLRVCALQVDSRSGFRFWEARRSYTKNAPIQAAMRRKLVELLLTHTGGKAFARVFEFGAGVGDFSALLQANLDYTQFVCNDINNHASILQARLSAHTQVMTFDMHDIKNQPIFAQRFDLIASNACLQWLRAREVLADVASMLADDGVLLLGSFGGQNCYEIRELFGIGLEYIKLAELCGLCESLGLEILHSSSEMIELECGSALGVFRHFRASGVALHTPKRVLSKSALLAYEKRFGGKITYEPIYILARKQLESS